MIGIVYGYCVHHSGVGRYIAEYLRHCRTPRLFNLLAIESEVRIPRISTVLVRCKRDARLMSSAENESFSKAVERISQSYSVIHSHGIYALSPRIYTGHLCLGQYLDNFKLFFGISRLPPHLRRSLPRLVETEAQMLTRPRPPLVVAVSKMVAEEYERRYGVRTPSVIHGCSRFSREDGPRLRRSKARYTIGFMGGQLYGKGTIFMKDVFNLLCSRGINVHCEGVRCDIQTVRCLSRGAKYTSRLVGRCDVSADYYAQLDAFLCLSICEGYSLTVLEAMSLGVPVVAGNSCGVLWDAQSSGLELARVKDVSNPLEVADVLERVLTDSCFRERVIESGYALTEEQSWKDVASRYEGLYAIK